MNHGQISKKKLPDAIPCAASRTNRIHAVDLGGQLVQHHVISIWDQGGQNAGKHQVKEMTD
jgi:hypothetical protein